MLKILLVPTLLALVLSACGGGGSSSSSTTATDPKQVFSLQKINSLEEGNVYQSKLVGTISDSYESLNVTGNLSIVNRKKVMLEGTMVTPRDMLISVTVNNTPRTMIETSYFTDDGYLMKTENDVAVETCYAVSPESLPTDVKIGDFGSLSALNCYSGASQVQSWRTEDGKNGHLLFIKHDVYKDQYGQTEEVGDTIYKLDTSGNIISLEFTSSSEGIILNLKSQ